MYSTEKEKDGGIDSSLREKRCPSQLHEKAMGRGTWDGEERSRVRLIGKWSLNRQFS